MNRTVLRLVLLGCVWCSIVGEAKNTQDHDNRVSGASYVSVSSKAICPKISGYALGDVITNEVCTYRYRRFDQGMWTSETYWKVPLKERTFGFTNNVRIVSDRDNRVVAFYLHDRVRVNPKKEDVRKRLVEQLLHFQKIIIKEGEFDSRLIGTNLVKSISLRGATAYDICQNLRFADADAEIYACYRSHGPTITVELRLCRGKQDRKSKVIRHQYNLPRNKMAPIGSYDNFLLGQKLDNKEKRIVRKLANPIFGCQEMWIRLSKKNRIWEIGFESSGEILNVRPFDDLMKIFLRHQECVVQHFDYPKELLGTDNVYFNEEFNASEGWTSYYITQWIDCVGGSIQIALNTSKRSGKKIEWKINVRAVNFKIDREDDE